MHSKHCMITGGAALGTLNVLEAPAEVLGRSTGDPPFADCRRGDQRVFFCDLERAGRDLDWQPHVAPREGIARLAGYR